MNPGLAVEPLQAERHDRNRFSCGVAELDQYLQRTAEQDTKRRVAVTYALIWRERPAEILGFYTLSSRSIRLSDFPPDVAKKLPRYPDVPATLIGRFAIDRGHRSAGYGRSLLMDALERSVTASRVVGSAAVIVDAKNDEVAGFYRRHDFVAFPSSPLRLYIPMLTVAKAFARAPGSSG